MIIVETAKNIPGDRFTQGCTYNGLDCCVTLEVYHQLRTMIDEESAAGQPWSKRTNEFSLTCLAPAIYMSLQGLAVQPEELERACDAIEAELDKLATWLTELNALVPSITFNPNSPKEMCKLFYDVLGLPEITNHKTRKPTTGKEALDTLFTRYYYARPFISAIRAYRKRKKLLATLRTGRDPDGRLRSSYNVGGTETNRWSSSSSAYGTGTNAQNIPDSARRVIVADPGMMFAYADLDRAESVAVAGASGDPAYRQATQEGNLHMTVARMVWPGVSDEAIQNEKIYYEHTRYDLSKRLGHGSNYKGTAKVIAKETGLPVELVEDFQGKYFGNFPGIPQWWDRRHEDLVRDQYLITAKGFRRWFLGRMDDPATLREAIAFEPQSLVGESLNEGMLRIFNTGVINRTLPVNLMAQIHDAALTQFPEELRHIIPPKLTELLTTTIEFPSGPLTIRASVEIGWNFGKYDEKRNPGGLRKWTDDDNRTRPESTKPAQLDRGLRTIL